MINKIKYFFDRMTCDIDAIEIDSDKKPWESPALMAYLKEYPNSCSMRNFRALEILQENTKLTKQVEELSRQLHEKKGANL